MPTELVAQCPSLKHVVFLGTGAASYMNVAELVARGVTVHTIKGYGDTAVAEHTIALMFAAARDVAGLQRYMADDLQYAHAGGHFRPVGGRVESPAVRSGRRRGVPGDR